MATILKNKNEILRRYIENATNETSHLFQRNGPCELIDSVALDCSTE